MRNYSKRTITLFAIAAVVLAGAGYAFVAAQGELYPERTAPEDILVSPEWVAERHEELVILDVGREFDDYEANRVPGAVFVEGSVVIGENAFLPDPELVAADLADAGVSHDTPVVVYDAGGSTLSSRFFWALEYLGHDQVHLLDGGWQAYEASGEEIATGVEVPARGDFTADLRPELLVDREEILEDLEAGGEALAILDVRTEAEFLGEDVRAERGGHIPGSTNINYTEAVDEDNTFRPLEQLAERFDPLLQDADGRPVTLCQGGFRAAHSYVVLRVLGYDDTSMYDGSWLDWGNQPDTPIDSEA